MATDNAVIATDDCIISVDDGMKSMSILPPLKVKSFHQSVARMNQQIQSYKEDMSKRVHLLQDFRYMPLETKFMLHPVGLFRRFWDVILALSVIYVCWFIPFSVAISWWTPSKSLDGFHTVLDVIFVVDIILNFRTAVVIYGELIQEPSVVAKLYLKTWFLVDFISVFPTEAVITAFANAASASGTGTSTKGVKLLKYVKLPKLLRLSQLVRRFRRFQRYEGSLTIFCAFIFVLHLASCIWILAIGPCDEPMHLEIRDFCDPSAIYDVYSLGFHYALSMITSMTLDVVFQQDNPLCGGFRNKINNITTSQIPSGLLMLSNFYSLFGVLLSSVIIGSSVFVVESWNRAGYQFRKRIDMINHEVEFLQLPEYLRARIKAYHQYLWTHQGSATERVSLLQDRGMSEPLRKEIAIFMYRDMLSKIPLFITASEQLLGMICLCLTTVIYLPHDIIITKGELGKNLFIIARGSVVVLGVDALLPWNPNDSKDHIILHEGSFFGEIGLLMEIERTRTVIAGSICELGVLTKKDFVNVMNQFPTFAAEINRIIQERKYVNAHAGEDNSQSDEKPSIRVLRRKRSSATRIRRRSCASSSTLPSFELKSTAKHFYSRASRSMSSIPNVIEEKSDMNHLEARFQRIEDLLKMLVDQRCDAD